MPKKLPPPLTDANRITLYRKLGVELLKAKVNMARVHFTGFLIKDDPRPKFTRYTIVDLYQIHDTRYVRSEDSPNGFGRSEYVPRGEFKISVKSSFPKGGRHSYYSRRVSGDFAVPEIVEDVKKRVFLQHRDWEAAESRRNRIEKFQGEKEEIESRFPARYFEKGPVELRVHLDGITVDLNVGLTGSETLKVLHFLDGMGLFPGGTREKELTEEESKRSRYERV